MENILVVWFYILFFFVMIQQQLQEPDADTKIVIRDGKKYLVRRVKKRRKIIKEEKKEPISIDLQPQPDCCDKPKECNDVVMMQPKQQQHEDQKTQEESSLSTTTTSSTVVSESLSSEGSLNRVIHSLYRVKTAQSEIRDLLQRVRNENTVSSESSNVSQKRRISNNNNNNVELAAELESEKHHMNLKKTIFLTEVSACISRVFKVDISPEQIKYTKPPILPVDIMNINFALNSHGTKKTSNSTFTEMRKAVANEKRKSLKEIKREQSLKQQMKTSKLEQDYYDCIMNGYLVEENNNTELIVDNTNTAAVAAADQDNNDILSHSFCDMICGDEFVDSNSSIIPTAESSVSSSSSSDISSLKLLPCRNKFLHTEQIRQDAIQHAAQFIMRLQNQHNQNDTHTNDNSSSISSKSRYMYCRYVPWNAYMQECQKLLEE